MSLTPSQAIRLVAQPLAGLPACIAGSTVAAELYDLPLHKSSDIDVFCYTEQALITAMEKLAAAGFTLDERFSRVRDRWLRYGFRNWHTNSIKYTASAKYDFIEVNLVYKLLGKVPLTSLSAVLESFDFGLLAAGYDLSDNTFRDLRSFLFPGMDLKGPLPLMPNKAEGWQNGFISQYNGLREPGRYAKYHSYGHDLSLVKPVLVDGYLKAVVYLQNRGGDKNDQLALIYQAIASKLENDEIDDLLQANALLLSSDALDLIMDALD